MTKNLRVKFSEYIDETNRISFKFNGKTYHGFKGDTLASALLANDVHLVGRSFKYHRPRGIMTSGAEEPNAIVQINPGTNRTVPNVRATEVEIYEGLEASSQNCWPSVEFDIGGINNFLSPFFQQVFIIKHLCGLLVSGRNMNFLYDTQLVCGNHQHQVTLTFMTTEMFTVMYWL